MKECSKSIVRRMSEPNFMTKYFVGRGIDIGGAPDPLNLYVESFPLMKAVRIWDIADGDAQFMQGVDDNSIDFVHSSHCLEHLIDPEESLKNWLRIIKPGGHIVVTVPDEDLYEQGKFPSTYNSDHKWTFTTFKTNSWSAKSVNLIELFARLGEEAELLKLELLNSSFRYKLPRFDQTLTPVAECAIEFVIRKRTEIEIKNGGREIPPGQLTKQGFSLLTGLAVK